MKKDNLFQNRTIKNFDFGKEITDVFDDMLLRSVPFYSEIIRMATELTNSYADSRTNIYELGCSTGNLLKEIMKKTKKNDLTFIGVDFSKDMLVKCEEKTHKIKAYNKCTLVCNDLNNNIIIQNASVVILCLTLQFVNPANRKKLLTNIYNNLNKNGCLILVEKTTCEDLTYNNLFDNFYYDFKVRNGYSKKEICNKKEAINNILIPYSLEENVKLLKNSGFKNIETFFKWYNFCGILAIKT